LINLARAIGRIVTSYKELQKLAGYTALVAELQDVLTDLSTGKYRRRMVKGERQLDENLKAGMGTVISNCDDIVFDKVPIVTPNGDLLAADVSFHITQKQNLMIVGPNGYVCVCRCLCTGSSLSV
jgi:ATP-binding cassette subfamily D (ALD) protein 3